MRITLKSPICRIGGKAYLTRFLLEHIPEHTTYVEPFSGGAKLLFSKEPSPIEILNDVDDNLVNLYRCIQDGEKRSRLIAFLNETPYARSVFQSWKYGDKTTLDDIEKSGRYFFLCKASFAGDVERGGFGMPSKGTGRNPARTHHLPVMWKGAVLVCLQRELAGIQQEHSGRRLIALILLQRGLRMRLSNAWIMLNVSRGMTVQRVCFIATHHI